MQSDQIAQVKSAFEARGESIAEWARGRGFSLHMVYAVLAGRCRAKRGQGHQISIALGLKPQPPTPPQ
ncbi:DNA-binding protein [Curvibacter sp. APW13]|uniref:DNA-binding protein n=1 Tax=Curvibacter sp. APW13 TaxID=3077236 RepID=UPI0028DFA749|nr:DNA-binding protein [Curvibacter sp. APW13]MDT8992677.1 DNA-binding protein [Curvibacter sp. APW13]